LDHFFIEVDVGIGIAGSGLFDTTGTLLASYKYNIRIWREAGNVVAQSSADIWGAICSSVRSSVARAGVTPEQISGIGFDVACSIFPDMGGHGGL
tara:strand:- start:74 stop:358 length:285 start_codon:yes stop_codon:yes gene_type:complete